MTISRRTMLAGSAGAAAATAMAAPGAVAAPVANPAGLRLLTSTDGVFTPPKGAPVMKFSFSNPEPSVEFGGLLFGFEVISFENSYGIDPATVTLRRSDGRLELKAAGFTWAGGTRRRAGSLTATLEKTPSGALEWQVAAALDIPVKSIKTIVRGLPRGRLSVSANDWSDPGDNERVVEYPALMGGMATPLVAIEGGDKRVWGISALQTEVRPARFAFLPGPDGYKTELLYEQAGWERSGTVTTCRWRIAVAADFAGVARPHFQAVEAAWRIPKLRERTDAPDWAKHVALVLSLHGEHWTGYVFNDFDRQLEILRWTAKQIDPKTVMVFLPGWDGRYYWDYPNFTIGKATGGEAAFRRLLTEGRKLGFRFGLMFGTNIANPLWPGFDTIADAQLRTIYDVPFASDYVDWDGDRKGEPSMVFMNVAVKSWRDHLKRRIADMLSRYPVDAYFLDICGLWENNPQGDQLVGTRTLVKELAATHPGVIPIAEMAYDAQMGFIPMNHVARYPLYPQASFDTVASFNHLSHAAPGRGSSGVHEIGFTRYTPVTIDQPQIPTITFVDDTFTKERDLVMKDIATARARFAARGQWT
ncbi:hypothetical protein QLH51_06430 [Sphingomonas sp. 2R-10]|uniref:hypothetical protein n=1 Tax=Sphingomonas sp. 2R-10 TaxID=3045148 RepID=UPI000F7AF42B|nr:hypothetical protein [Sphingomonas sp. 2R-10]MDJ0276433.1 hypothetical protein [Sphingomonas sp. 2R-10]